MVAERPPIRARESVEASAIAQTTPVKKFHNSRRRANRSTSCRRLWKYNRRSAPTMANLPKGGDAKLRAYSPPRIWPPSRRRHLSESDRSASARRMQVSFLPDSILGGETMTSIRFGARGRASEQSLGGGAASPARDLRQATTGLTGVAGRSHATPTPTPDPDPRDSGHTSGALRLERVVTHIRARR